LFFKYDSIIRLVKTTVKEELTKYFCDNAGNKFIKKGMVETTHSLKHGQIATAMDVEVKSDQGEENGKIFRTEVR
jgi:hypothetical protein